MDLDFIYSENAARAQGKGKGKSLNIWRGLQGGRREGNELIS